MADNTVTIEVELLDKATKSLATISDRLDKLGKTAEKATEKSVTGFQVFQATLASGVALKALGAIQDAASALFQTFIVEGVQASSEYEVALNQLNQALIQTGQFSNQASFDLAAFAQTIQETTKFSDDAVLSAAALIQQIAKLSATDLQTATQAAADLAAALGIDLQSAASLVAKSIEGNSGALGRYGIKVKEGADETERFKNTLAALSSQQGSATATGNTFAGSIAILGNAFQDLQKIVGTAITQNPVVIAVFKQLGDILKSVTETVEANKVAIRAFVGESLIFLIDGLAKTVRALELGRQTFVVINQSMIAFAAGVTSLAAIIPSFISGGLSKLVDFLGFADSAFKRLLDTVAGFSDFLGNKSSEAATLAAEAFKGPSDAAELIASSLEKVEAAGVKAFNAVGPATEDYKAKINATTAAVTELTDAQKKQIEELDKFLIKEREQTASANETATARLEALRLYAEEKNLTEFQILEAELIIEQERQDAQAAADEKRYTDLIAQNEQLAIIDDAESQARIDRNKNEIAQITAAQEAGSKLEIKIKSDTVKKEKEINAQKLQATKDIFGNIAALAGAFGKEGFEIFRAASLAESIVGGILAVQKALASAPPPFNIVLAASVGALAAVNTAKIASSKPPGLRSGIDSVPGIGASDNFPAILAPGERVVPRRSNEDLTSFLAQQGNSAGLLASIDSKLSRLQNQFTVNIGSRTIVQEIRDSLDSGRVLAV